MLIDDTDVHGGRRCNLPRWLAGTIDGGQIAADLVRANLDVLAAIEGKDAIAYGAAFTRVLHYTQQWRDYQARLRQKGDADGCAGI